jgi:hypothetical protein
MLAMVVSQLGAEEALRMQFTADTSIDQLPEDSPVRHITERAGCSGS